MGRILELIRNLGSPKPCLVCSAKDSEIASLKQRIADENAFRNQVIDDLRTERDTLREKLFLTARLPETARVEPKVSGEKKERVGRSWREQKAALERTHQKDADSRAAYWAKKNAEAAKGAPVTDEAVANLEEVLKLNLNPTDDQLQALNNEIAAAQAELEA